MSQFTPSLNLSIYLIHSYVQKGNLFGICQFETWFCRYRKYTCLLVDPIFTDCKYKVQQQNVWYCKIVCICLYAVYTIAFLPIWRKKTGKSGHVTVQDFLVCAQGC